MSQNGGHPIDVTKPVTHRSMCMEQYHLVMEITMTSSDRSLSYYFDIHFPDLLMKWQSATVCCGRFCEWVDSPCVCYSMYGAEVTYLGRSVVTALMQAHC